MKLYQLIAISLSTLTLYSCSGTPVRRSVVNPLPRESASWHKSESFKGDDALFPKQVISSKYDVRKPDKVTAAQLDLIFRGKLEGKGREVIRISRQYEICPRFYASLICHESAAGTSKYAREANNVIGQMQRNKKTGKWTAKKFNSIDECLDFGARKLKESYIAEGRYTIEAIQKKYCPVITNRENKDFNDPRGYNKFWTDGVIKYCLKIG